MPKNLPKSKIDAVIKAYREQGENLNKSALAERLGINRKTVRAIINREKKSQNDSFEFDDEQQLESKSGKVDKNLVEFRRQYDDSYIIPKKIEEGVKKYLVDEDGDPRFMKDYDFRTKLGIPPNKWRRYADDFKHLQVRKDGDLVWGHPDIIEFMREYVSR